MQNLRASEMRAQPRQAEIHFIELQHWPPPRISDQHLDIGLHARVPRVCRHVQTLEFPLLREVPAEPFQPLVLGPVVRDAQMSDVNLRPTCFGIEPTPLVEGLVIGGEPRNTPEEIPQEGAAAAVPASDENEVRTAA